MGSKHTSGPWNMMDGGFVTTSPKDPNLVTIYATNENLEIICKVYKDRMLVEGSQEQDHKANARLIAASPEMYDLLKYLYMNEYCGDHREEVESLLNKIDNA